MKTILLTCLVCLLEATIYGQNNQIEIKEDKDDAINYMKFPPSTQSSESSFVKSTGIFIFKTLFI